MIAWIVFGWLVPGVAGAGFFFAYFQGNWPDVARKHFRADLGVALLLAVIYGPINLIVQFFCSGFGKHGWRLWPKKDAA